MTISSAAVPVSLFHVPATMQQRAVPREQGYRVAKNSASQLSARRRWLRADRSSLRVTLPLSSLN